MTDFLKIGTITININEIVTIAGIDEDGFKTKIKLKSGETWSLGTSYETVCKLLSNKLKSANRRYKNKSED